METRRTAIALLAAIGCLAGARTDGRQAAQGPPATAPVRDTPARSRAHRQTGTAAISGTVVGLSSSQPVADATVSIYAPELPDGQISTTTDDQGRFTFVELAAGRYTVGTSKPGFVNVLHGQRRVSGAGRALAIQDGEHLDIQLKLPRTSAITGTVLDEHGYPAIDASVRVFRFSMIYGYRRPEAGASATTDDRGIYRVHSLQPGEYAVCATTRNTRPLNDGQRVRMQIDRLRRMMAYQLDPQSPDVQQQFARQLSLLEPRLPAHVDPVLGYAPVCHPGTPSLPSLIRFGPDEERTGVDFQLTLVRLARIEGLVTGMPPVRSEMEPIELVNADETLDATTESTRADAARRFSFSDVAPGRYTLLVRTAAGSAAPDARLVTADVVVAGEDVSNVVLELQRGATIEGRVVFRGTTPPPPILAGTRVRIDPASPGPQTRLMGIPAGSVDATGRFVVSNIPPGQYRISATAMESNGWYVDSATLSGRDAINEPFAVKAQQTLTGAIVTLTDQGAEIAGTMVTNKGDPAPQYVILVYPPDEKYWTAHSRRMFVTRARQDGGFIIRGVPAGNYRLATLLDPAPGVWFDPAYVRSLEARSIVLSIADHERKVLNLRVPDDR